jgi:HlyD family secretion protein
VVWENADVLQVPLSALFRCGGAWCVFRATGGQAQHRVVAIGHRREAMVEVRQGLAAGDAVILHPNDHVEDGKRVEPR